MMRVVAEKAVHTALVHVRACPEGHEGTTGEVAMALDALYGHAFVRDVCEAVGATCPSGHADPRQCWAVAEVAVGRCLFHGTGNMPLPDPPCCCTHAGDVWIPLTTTAGWS